MFILPQPAITQQLTAHRSCGAESVRTERERGLAGSHTHNVYKQANATSESLVEEVEVEVLWWCVLVQTQGRELQEASGVRLGDS